MKKLFLIFLLTLFMSSSCFGSGIVYNKGQKVPETCMFVFSATWCGPCKEYQRELDNLGIDYYIVDMEKNVEFGRRLHFIDSKGAFRVPRTAVLCKKRWLVGQRLQRDQLVKLKRFLELNKR
jgi:glutaredoxin-related protein